MTTLQELVRAAYLDGFRSSCEGFNGEYPPDAAERDDTCARARSYASSAVSEWQAFNPAEAARASRDGGADDLERCRGCDETCDVCESRHDYVKLMLAARQDGRKDTWVGDWLIRCVGRVINDKPTVRWSADHAAGVSVGFHADAHRVARLMRAVDAGLAGVER